MANRCRVVRRIVVGAPTNVALRWSDSDPVFERERIGRTGLDLRSQLGDASSSGPLPSRPRRVAVTLVAAP